MSTVGTRYVASIQVGGGRPVPVTVDTGSSGLVIDSAAVGSAFTATGQHLERHYGFATEGTSNLATSIITTVTTLDDGSRTLSTGMIPVATFADSSRSASMRRTGTYGILGVGPNIAPHSYGLMSPLAQLPAPFWAGFTLDPAAHVLRLGQPQVTSPSAVVPLTRSGVSFPNGHSSWSKDVQLCWSVGARRTCGPTAVDSGGNNGTVSSTLLPDVDHLGNHVAAGTRVAIATPTGQPIGSATSSSLHPVNYTSADHFNSGALPFTAGAVGFDLLDGKLVFQAG
ncbi:hypothetical protein [Nostocoides sp. HKS02]|uniref:hypothetical protein n=1 Tax=Nostocoides sp. HKS02 TaxID=1813880 RepID=UPI0012B45589|nr:hypothetical protein [Tetrasphaera sp. HKS02]QGN59098.1 hypothetical protein GKE56_15745 [Tetrasphaera sp. HKS02]